MTSGPRSRITIPKTATVNELPQLTLRLRMKPKAPTTGFVDGAWWPRSLDLSAELPALLAVLAVRLGPIQRVSYNLADWEPVERRLDIGGHTVRLGGFHSQRTDTIDVIGADGVRITLLVVPPPTPPDAAHVMLMAAAHRGNNDQIDELLSRTGAPASFVMPKPRAAAEN
ncbi:MAG TPA: DUF5994 family protein [Actinophytocola sp.]|uniref:DUF5994 family protein n=1 Tax=Actinophytocola sp. TaxID=1872138 RepID=UPI002DBCD8FA|nr:DUF5994 family protein [Actinophytocola sp.]HEU5475308.1 DUF5994 family protein [Actinophytocola sp.]